MWKTNLKEVFENSSGTGCGATLLFNSQNKHGGQYGFLDFELKGLKILEIGFGEGKFAEKLTRENEYWGIDIGGGAHKDVLKKKLNEQGARFLRLDVNKDDFPLLDDYFDACFILETLEHLANPCHCVEEIKRVLKDNGRLIVVFPRPEDNLGYSEGLHAHIYPGFLLKKSFRMFMRQLFFRIKDYRVNGSSAYYRYENVKTVPMINEKEGEVSPHFLTTANYDEGVLFGELKKGEWTGPEPETENDYNALHKLIELDAVEKLKKK